jgi:hypothetical protein
MKNTSSTKATQGQTAGHGMSKKKQETPPAASRTIESYRHCPICWEQFGGYGLAYSTQGATRYYKCKKSDKPGCGPCGHTWTATVKVEVLRVEHRPVKLDGER